MTSTIKESISKKADSLREKNTQKGEIFLRINASENLPEVMKKISNLDIEISSIQLNTNQNFRREIEENSFRCSEIINQKLFKDFENNTSFSTQEIEELYVNTVSKWCLENSNIMKEYKQILRTYIEMFKGLDDRKNCRKELIALQQFLSHLTP